MLRIGIIHKQIPSRPETITEENIRRMESLAEDVRVILCESEDELIEKCPDAEILLCWGIDCPIKWVSGAKSLKWIQSFSAGIEALMPIRKLRPELIITKMTGVHAYPMAESALMYILMFLNRMPYFAKSQRLHLWEKKLPPYTTDDCSGKTVGIVGMGEIGNVMAERFQVFGLKVLSCRRTIREEDRADVMYSLDEIENMLPLCDFVISLVPASLEATRMFNEKLFALFKDGAYFISMGRGMVVDETALVNALDSGKLRGAALDVFNKEPLSPESPLWDKENVIITPHCSATTAHNFDLAIESFCNNFEKYSSGTLQG